jgi:hypothetical protein
MNLQSLVIVGIAIYVMTRYSIESAVLNVYLPVLMLMSTGYALLLPHMPAFSFSSLALYPIIIWILMTRRNVWRLQRTDLWLLLFCFEAPYSEYVNSRVPGNGIFAFAGFISDYFLPYMLGKMLLEEAEFRERFARRLVFLCFLISVLSIFEFVTGKNLFYLTYYKTLSGWPGWYDQHRYGFTRLRGSLPGPENAGMVFIIGILLALWLRFTRRLTPVPPEPKHLKLRDSTWMVIGIVLGSAMTLSRGPWMGTAFGFLIARIGKAKNLRLALTLTTVLTLGAYLAAQKWAADYTNVTQAAGGEDSVDETRQTAIYRKKAFEQYEVIAQHGGLLGWGLSNWPKVQHLESIDNEYLLLRVSQGKLGYWLFLLMFAEAALAITRAVMQAWNPIDIYFYFCLAGAIAGILATIMTVYITGQTAMLLYLMLGWTQSLRQNPLPPGCLIAPSPPRFQFKRVFV